jgi:plastocyanin
MAGSRPSSSWVLPFAVAWVVLGVLVLVVVPVVAILSGAGPFGDDGPKQTPFVTDDDSVTVTIRDFTYFPEDLSVNLGAEVTWLNEDGVIHDATDRDGAWETELLGEGESGTITLDEPGSFEYYCTVHPYMEGRLIVREAD